MDVQLWDGPSKITVSMICRAIPCLGLFKRYQKLLSVFFCILRFVRIGHLASPMWILDEVVIRTPQEIGCCLKKFDAGYEPSSSPSLAAER